MRGRFKSLTINSFPTIKLRRLTVVSLNTMFKRKTEYFPLSRELLHDYSERTTIHGIRYICDSKRSLLERTYWLIAFILSILCCFTLIKNVYDKLERTPVMVSFADKSMSVINIPVPSVTICPENKFRYDAINVSDIIEREVNGNHQNYINWDIHRDLVGQICQPSHKILKFENSSKFISYNIFEWLQKSQRNIEELLVHCDSSLEYQYPCNIMFRKVFTEAGVCYNFNGLMPEDLYRDDVAYIRTPTLVKSLYYRADTWSPEDGYKNPLDSNYPTNALGGIFTDRVFLVLNQNYEDRNPLCTFFQGFKMFLHSPSDMPISRDEFIKLPPNTDIRIAVQPEVVITSDELKTYSPKKRGCFFSYERQLKFFKIYSENNCWMECLTNYTLQGCGCVFFYMPRLNSTSICGMANYNCLEESKRNIKTMTLQRKSNQSLPLCDCLPSCTSISYRTDSSPSESNNSLIIKFLGYYNNAMSDDSMLITLRAFYKTAEFTPIRRSELFSKTDLVASCGGLLGLFMGFSVLSFIEIIYFCTIRPIMACRIRRQMQNRIKIQNKNILQVKEWPKIKLVKSPTALVKRY